MMTPERWQHLKPLFHSALERQPHERVAFLNQACAGDAHLRAELESLIAAHEQTGEFLDAPAYAVAATLLADDLTGLAVGQFLGHYQIVDLLGAGGMGEVYLARDTKLERAVALKILPAEAASDRQRMQRFVREAKSVSALNHPNILTIYEISSENDRPFIATEFIDGETLRASLSRSRLSLREALDVAIQIASALVAAHKAGIVHRDIKPENIMVRREDRLVKVLDFGLVKLLKTHAPPLVNAEAPTRALVKTGAGVVMGTVHYMSPEQARGLAVDERTDIWSLGVVLYEMLAGRAPFTGDTPLDTLVAILDHEPPTFAPREGEIPDELNWIVTKALCKDRAERYQTAEGLLSDLKSLRHRVEVETELVRFVAPERNTEARPAATSDGVPLAGTSEIAAAQTGGASDIHTTSSAEYLISEIKRHPRGALLILATLLVVAATVAYFASSRYFAGSGAAGIESVAVLPFVNESGNADVEYLSDGMTETLISSLSQLPNLAVKARSSVFRYKGKDVEAQQAGSQLNVQAILNGRVVQRGDDLALYLSLVDARTGNQLWGEQYNRKLTDLVSLQGEIARDVSQKLQARLSGADEQKLTTNYTANTEAYRLYLKGRFHVEKSTLQDFQKAIECFQRAIALDPNFAAAYAKLAGVYVSLSNSGNVPSRDLMLKAKEATLKALSLDDQLAAAHGAFGVILHAYDYDFAGAEREFKRALEVNPNDESVHQSYGELLTHLGRHEEALAEHRRALEIDPLSHSSNLSFGLSLFYARRYDEAIAHMKETAELDDDFWLAHLVLAMAFQMKGDYAASVAEWIKVQEMVGTQETAALMRESFAKGGWQGFLRAMTGNRRPSNIPPYLVLTLHAELGEKDKIFAILNKLYENRSPQLLTLKVEPRFDPLRDDPRFQDLLRRVGLPQ